MRSGKEEEPPHTEKTWEALSRKTGAFLDRAAGSVAAGKRIIRRGWD